jgi:hypothetical protein
VAMDIYRFFDSHGSDVLTIDPSVLPSGVGLSISGDDQRTPSGFLLPVTVGTVYASRQCTG